MRGRPGYEATIDTQEGTVKAGKFGCLAIGNGATKFNSRQINFNFHQYFVMMSHLVNANHKEMALYRYVSRKKSCIRHFQPYM